MKKHIFTLCLTLAIGLGVQNANAQEKVEEINPGDIAMSLSVWHAPQIRKPLCTPQVIIWEDGRILFGDGKQEYDREKQKYVTTHTFGKIDPKVIAPLQKTVSESFRLGKANIFVSPSLAVDGDTFFLRTKFDNGFFSSRTSLKDTEGHARSVRSTPIPTIIAAENTKDGKPVLLPEYYDAWIKVQKTIFDTGKQAVAKDAIPVDVEVKHYDVLTVKDKEGKVLLRQDFGNHFSRKVVDSAELAKRIAIKKFIDYRGRDDHQKYDITVMEGAERWTVSFDNKGADTFFGDHAIVLVDKTTGEARLLPGG